MAPRIQRKGKATAADPPADEQPAKRAKGILSFFPVLVNAATAAAAAVARSPAKLVQTVLSPSKDKPGKPDAPTSPTRATTGVVESSAGPSAALAAGSAKGSTGARARGAELLATFGEFLQLCTKVLQTGV